MANVRIPGRIWEIRKRGSWSERGEQGILTFTYMAEGGWREGGCRKEREQSQAASQGLVQKGPPSESSRVGQNSLFLTRLCTIMSCSEF